MTSSSAIARSAAETPTPPDAGPRPSWRIVQVNSATKWIGEAAHTFELCRGLRERGHDVLLCCRPESELGERAQAAGLLIEPLNLGRGFRWGEEYHDWRRLREVMAKQATQVVHAHRGKDHWVAAGALVGWRPAADAPMPLLVRTRHVVMTTRHHPPNTWLFHRRTAMVTAVSRAAAASLGDYWEAVPRRRIVPPGVDLARFDPARRRLAHKRAQFGIPEDAPLVGLIGRIQRIKGQHVFLEAAERLAARLPHVHFLCAGRHSTERGDSLVDRGRGGPLGARWHVVGWLEDVEELVATLDVGVIPSLGSEGASRVALEYLASGLPVVASRVGGLPDVREASPAFDMTLVAPGDAGALAEAIVAALGERAEATEPRPPRVYPAEALATISRERWLDEMESCYAEALAGDRATAPCADGEGAPSGTAPSSVTGSTVGSRG